MPLQPDRRSNHTRESASLIRSERRRWHAQRRFCIHSGENFLFAKIRDSEFAHIVFAGGA
jgi:hypothetical protein